MQQAASTIGNRASMTAAVGRSTSFNVIERPGRRSRERRANRRAAPGVDRSMRCRQQEAGDKGRSIAKKVHGSATPQHRKQPRPTGDHRPDRQNHRQHGPASSAQKMAVCLRRNPRGRDHRVNETVADMVVDLPSVALTTQNRHKLYALCCILGRIPH
jgi:hypothetical protein